MVLFEDDTSVTVMNGEIDDIHRAKRLRKTIDGPFLWFRRHGNSYLVRDAATLAAARSIFEPQSKLGERQSSLGERQEELGAQQEELGRLQEELSAKADAAIRELLDGAIGNGFAEEQPGD